MMAPATRILVMRHGESESNVLGIWTTSPHGNPLTERGVSQAREAGRRLVGDGVAAVYGSPIPRASQTAAEVAGVLGLAPVDLPGVEEMDVGEFDGAHESVVLPRAMAAFEAWLGGDLAHAYEGGDSGQDLADRFHPALARVAEQHPGQTVVVVSHGGAMILGLVTLCDNLSGLDAADLIIHNTEVVEIRRTDGGWSCVSWCGRPVDAVEVR